MSLNLSQLNVGKVNQPALSEPSAYAPILAGNTEFPQITVIRPDIIPYNEYYDRHVLLTYQTNSPIGAPYMANGQVSVSTSQSVILSARSTRKTVIIRNNDSTTTMTVGVSAPTFTINSGMVLSGGQNITLDFTGAIMAISPGGVIASYIETYY